MNNLTPEMWLNQEWRRLERRMVARIEERASDLCQKPLHISTSTYTDRHRFEAERRQLFLTTPLLAGLSREIPEPGNVLLFDAAGPSIVIVRTQTGSLNAFLNMCPHRGAKLVNDTKCKSAFVCPFHAWRFDLAGKLIQRPLEPAFSIEGVNPHLTRLPVSEKYGMIFVRCDPQGEYIDIDEFLGPIAPLLQNFELADAELIKADQLAVKTNWKLAVDTSCEGYHVPATHPTTLHPQLVPFLTIHDSFGRHHRFCGPSRKLEQCVGKAEHEWPTSSYSAVHYLFPNTILTYTDAIDGNMPILALNRSFPGAGIDEAVILYTTYKPKPAAQAADDDFIRLHDTIIDINKTEDLPMVERVWRNYDNLPNPASMIFGRNEMILQRYHADIAEAIGMPLESHP